MTQRSQGVPLDMPDATRKALERLADTWEHRFHGKLDDAEIEQSKLFGRILNAEGFCYARCARELKKLLKSGNAPPDFELQVLKNGSDCDGRTTSESRY